MKTSLKLLFVLFPILCHAQENPDRFRVGLSYSPQMILKKQDVKNIKSNYCYSTGVNGSVRIGDRFRIELGAQYAVRKFTRDNILLSPQKDTTFSIGYTLRYIEIPLTIKYTWKQTPKWSFTVGIGAIQQLPIEQRTSWNMFAGNDVRRGFLYSKDQQKADLYATGAILLVGVDYQMTSRIHCVFQPFTMNYFTNKSLFFANQTGWLAGGNLLLQYSL